MLVTDKSALRPNGSLISDAVLTRAGVFLYEDGQGGIIRVLRPPEEVFHPKSLDTLRLVPLTLLHPDAGEVSPDTFADSNVIGTVGDDVRVVGDEVVATVAVHERTALEAHQQGVRELSCGYHAHRTTEVRGVAADGSPYHYKAPGIWTDARGESHEFDMIQSDIVYNHCAQLPAGRAGSARFLDAAAGHDMDEQKGESADTQKAAEDNCQEVDGSVSVETVNDAQPVVLKLGEEEFRAPSLAAAMGMLQALLGEKGGDPMPEASDAEEGAEEPTGEEVAEQLAGKPEDDAFPVGMGKEKENDAAALSAELQATRAQVEELRNARVLDSVGPFLDSARVARPDDLREAICLAITTKVPGSPTAHLTTTDAAFAAWQVIQNIPATAAPATHADKAESTDSRQRVDAAWKNGPPSLH